MGSQGTDDHSAAGPLAGYLWQLQRALLVLLELDPGERIEIETNDDVVLVNGAGEITAAIQAKHSFDDGSLTTRSVEFWKTIGAWVPLIKNGKLVSQSTLRLCATSSVATGSQLEQLVERSAQRPTDWAPLRKVLDPVAKAKGNAKLKSCYLAWLSLPLPDRENLLSRIVIVPAQLRLGEVRDEIEKKIRRSGVRQEFVTPFRQRLEAWFNDQLAKRLSNGGCAFTADELHAKLVELHEVFAPATIQFHAAAIAIPDVAAEQATNPVYLRQLQLLGAEAPAIATAVAMFHKGSAERQHMLDSRINGKEFLAEYDTDLRNRWQVGWARHCRRPRKSQDEEIECGWSVHDHCMDYQGSIAGVAAPTHLACGTYHACANQLQIGWHPRYAENLRK